MSKKHIISLLMKRDGITYEEAKETVDDVQELINETLQMSAESPFEGYAEIEDILSSELGLEMDYIFDFL